MTVQQLEDKFKAEMEGPEKLKKLLSSSPTSEAAFTAAAYTVRLTDVLIGEPLANVAELVGDSIDGWAAVELPANIGAYQRTKNHQTAF